MPIEEAATKRALAAGATCGMGLAIGESYARRLVAAGVPFTRVRIGQRLANPLLSARGVIRTPEETTEYTAWETAAPRVFHIGGLPLHASRSCRCA